MRITEILDLSNIIVQLNAENKEAALNTMINSLENSSKVENINKVRTAILEREKLMSTGVGHGFAIPHGKTDGVNDITAVFATCASPIAFDSLDNQPVNILFMLVAKETQVGTHLKMLSRISRLMNSVEFREKVVPVSTQEEILELLRNEEDKYFENTPS